MKVLSTGETKLVNGGFWGQVFWIGFSIYQSGAIQALHKRTKTIDGSSMAQRNR